MSPRSLNKKLKQATKVVNRLANIQVKQLKKEAAKKNKKDKIKQRNQQPFSPILQDLNDQNEEKQVTDPMQVENPNYKQAIARYKNIMKGYKGHFSNRDGSLEKR